MEIKEIPTPTMPDWLKLYNTYDPEYYAPGKRVSAEEWNTLFLASVRQGNYNADTLELLIKTYLPETYLTQVDFNQFSNEMRTAYSTFTNNIQEGFIEHKTQVQDQYDTFTTQVQEDFTALTSEVNSLEARVIKAEDVAYSLNDVIQEANEYAQAANQTAIESNTFAQEAKDNASTALETANSAASTAASSNNTAQDALSTAQSVVTTANNAATQATQAVNTANAASLRAEDAIATANAAKAESATAKNTAAQAETTANASNTTAESANDTASEAKRIAQNALNLVTERQGSQVIIDGVFVDTFNADTKADLDYVDRQIAALIGAAPETLDTLEEVAKAIAENETVVDALNAAIGTKANKTDLDNYLPISGGTMTGALYFDNNKFIKGYTTTSTLRNLIGVDSSSDIELGDTGANITVKAASAFRPASNNATGLGTSELQWKEIHGTTIYQSGKQVANAENLSAVTDATLSSDSKTLTVTKRDGTSFDFKGGSDIPTKTSQLTNDSGFINKDVNNLTNYLPLTGGDMRGALVMMKETPLRFRYASQYFTKYLIELYGYEDKNHNTSGIFFRSGSATNTDINNTEITTERKKFRMIDADGILYSGGDAYSNKVATMNNLTNYLPLTGGHLTGLVTTTNSFNILNSTGSARLGSIGAYDNTYVSIDANNGIVLSTKAYSKKWFLIIGDDGSLTFQQ